jgi:hypothetical protein
VQVHQNLDDGVEFFGGTVNVSHLVLTAIGDDSLDWSFGWTGKAQYVAIKQDVAGGDNAFEADNNEDNPAWTPLTSPTVSNVTIVGADGTNGVRLRNGTAGTIKNLVVTGGDSYSNCLRVNGDESIANADAGELSVTHSAVACSSSSAFGSDTIGTDTTQAWFEGQDGNSVLANTAALGFDSTGYVPAGDSVLLGSGFDASTLDEFFDSTDYKGAFDGQSDWTLGWVTVGLED